MGQMRAKAKRQVTESFKGYTNARLAQVVAEPHNPDTGLEVNQDAAFEELMRRYDAMSDDMIKDFIKPSKAKASSIGFDDSFECQVISIAKPMPPKAPKDFEWIPPTFLKKDNLTALFSLL